ncbi:hypothetical protein Pmani_038164 [Petrolisthes manimaculis]|uniref:Uncharacterized protein n=1 Tax=Petrolisthes manimaculis TaxID=1843537 RepID=A0AAE1NHN9_9EUCA|nr:hypothetical protein Pmani_038164 [Petrolisthes manimaculis]
MYKRYRTVLWVPRCPGSLFRQLFYHGTGSRHRGLLLLRPRLRTAWTRQEDMCRELYLDTPWDTLLW